MKSFGPTSVFDCQTIVKAYEKAAIFTNDEKAVYAMTTPIISKIRSDARNANERIGKKFELIEKMKEREGFQDAGTDKPYRDPRIDENAQAKADTISNALDSNTYAANATQGQGGGNTLQKPLEEDKGWLREALYGTEESRSGNGLGAFAQRYMTNCIPCEQVLRDSEQVFEAFSWKGMGESILAIEEAALFASMEKLKRILNMFRNQGLGALNQICRFMNSFEATCPADWLLIIKALSSFLVKISFDLLGDLNWIADLLAALIGPILSAIVSMLAALVEAVIRPIECLWKALFEKQLGDVAKTLEVGGDFLADLTTTSVGGQAVIDGDGFGTPNIGDDPNQRTRSHPWTGDMSTPNYKVKKTGNPSPTTYGGDVSHFWHEQGTPHWLSSADWAALDNQVSALKRKKPDKGTWTNKEKDMEEEWNKKQYGRFIDNMKDVVKASKKHRETFTSLFDTVIAFLKDFAYWIENFARDYLRELGRMNSDNLTIELGFLDKQEKKLTILSLIPIISAILKFDHSDCDESEALQRVLTEAYGYSDKLVVKTEDGKIRIIDKEDGDTVTIANDIAPITLATFNIGDPVYDSEVADVEAVYTNSTALTFSCNNKADSKSNTEDLSRWIKELDEIS